VLFDLPVVDGWRLVGWGALTGIVVGALYLLTKPARVVGKPHRWARFMFGWIGAIVYGWGVVALLNGLLPQAAPQRFEEPILGAYISGGKSHTYNLTLPPFGPVTHEDAWDVGRQVYGEVQIGGHVCVDIYPGALGEPWYNAEACAPSQLKSH
jgi:hypothetical protein